MKSYTTIVRGKTIERLVDMPKEFRGLDLRLTLTPVTTGKKKKERFSKLYSKPVKVSNICIPSKEEINER